MGEKADPAAQYEGDKANAVWLPNKAIAVAWMTYMHDNSVADNTPPPATTGLVIKDSRLTWKAEADLESGLAYFIIERSPSMLSDLNLIKILSYFIHELPKSLIRVEQ